MQTIRISLLVMSTICLGFSPLQAQQSKPAPFDYGSLNHDESKVRAYTLPDPLVMRDGRRVTTAKMWRDERRGELLELFETQVYGRKPPTPEGIRFRVVETLPAAIHGKATRKRIRVELSGQTGEDRVLTVHLLVPNQAAKPVPAFVGVHLFDTAAAEPLPGVPLGIDVGEALPGKGIAEVILDRGYAFATLNMEDFCPDDAARFRQGVLNCLYPGRSGLPGPEEVGALATWAWGLSRTLDYMETDADIDARHVAVIGHSRAGKTALWAGAQDERFALVISNNSGCGGAALSRRNYGESVASMVHTFPYWCCGNFSKYADREDQLPVDQHELIALIAPRPVYTASAEKDRWCDPRGEFLAAAGADPVYRLLGVSGLGRSTDEPPPMAKSVGDSIGYHIRPGKHNLTDFDWLRYLDFADRHFGKQVD